ncbi:MAG: succinate semialdehyde dehydrogenase NADP+ linked [Trizodia sp. TS-e1964]|nr:MAG: succinate semialdehyde dehydrogenase NADP+ linked [Trizodia sp. TS-e1964]
MTSFFLLSRCSARLPAQLSLRRLTRSLAISHSPPSLNDSSLLKRECYVNGEWVGAQSGKTFEVQDPASLKAIASCPEFSSADTEAAIAAAATAFKELHRTTGLERARMLGKWHALVKNNAEDLAKLITWENGKPLKDAQAEVTYSAGFLEFFAGEATRTYGDTIPSSFAGNRVITLKEPVGVCALLSPWNFPLAMMARKVGPALAAGCAVVAKCPAETPLTGLAFAELAHRAGIHAGAVNFITSHENTSEVGETLTSSPTVRKVSFTGSTNVGKLLMKQSAGTLKKLSFELGGNSPFIVFDDADLDLAVEGAMACKFRGSSQTCTSINRLYVQSSIHDEFVARFTERVSKISVGSGFANGVTHGPLIHSRAISKVEAHVNDAKSKGGIITTGGEKLSELGPNFFQPTVITNMNHKMRLASEETFGPVAGIFRFDSEKEAVELANASEVGLAGYFYSRDVSRVWRVAEALEVGMVGINTGLISDPVSPFGGVKFSGFGREGSKYGLAEYQVIKTITFGGMGQPLQGAVS